MYIKIIKLIGKIFPFGKKKEEFGIEKTKNQLFLVGFEVLKKLTWYFLDALHPPEQYKLLTTSSRGRSVC